MPTLAINHPGFTRHRKTADIHDDTTLAKHIGVDATTVHRVLAGKNAPSARFIGGALNTFKGAKFADLFLVVVD